MEKETQEEEKGGEMIYILGALITLGMIISDEEAKPNKKKGWKDSLALLGCLIVWPVLWGIAIQDYLRDNGGRPIQ